LYISNKREIKNIEKGIRNLIQNRLHLEKIWFKLIENNLVFIVLESSFPDTLLEKRVSGLRSPIMFKTIISWIVKGENWSGPRGGKD
jgi:hypothetical protein